MLHRIKNWFTSSTSQENILHLDLARVLTSSLIASGSLSVIAILFALLRRTPNWERFVRDAVGVLLLSFILWLFLRRGYVRLVSFGIVAGFGAFATFTAFTGIGVQGTSYGLFLLVVMVSALFVHRRFAYVVALLGSLIGLGLIYAHQAGWMPNADRPLAEVASWLIQVTYFFIAAVILDIALRQIDRAWAQARHELEERKRAEEKILELNAALEQRITERTAQLAASEERYRLIANVSADYVFSSVVDMDGRVSHHWVAGAFESIMGCTFEEYKAGGGWLSVLYPDDVAQDAKDMDTLLRNQSITTEVRIITKMNEVRWVRAYCYPVWSDAENRLAGIYGAVQDITARKQIEESLIHERNLLQALMDNIPETIYFKDRASKFTRVNLAQAHFLGCDDPNTVLGKTDFDFQASELAESFFAEEQMLMERGIPLLNRLEYNPDRAGTPRWLSATKVPLRDTMGEIIGMVGISHNITERVQAETALREAELRYRTLVEKTSVVIYRDTPDSESKTLYISPQIEALLGYTVEEWVGGPLRWQNLLHPDDLEHARGLLAFHLQNKGSFTDEYRIKALDGRWVWVRDEAVVVEDADGIPLFVQGVLIDITEQKRAETQAQEITDGLRKLVDVTDALIMIPDLETFYRRAVELARERLGLERCSLFLFDEELKYQYGTFGTNEKGLTTDERFLKLDLAGEVADKLLLEGERSLLIVEGKHVAWDAKDRSRIIGQGWIATTLIRSATRPIGVFSNDAALTNSPVNEIQQEILLIYCSLLGNIIERKRAEEALRNNEKRFRALVEQLPAITYSDDITQLGRTIYISPQVEIILGYSTEEWLTGELDFWLTHIHPEDRAQAYAEYEACFQQGIPVNSEYRMLTRAGREVWFHDRAVRLVDEAGQPTLIQGVMTDITQQKQTEERIRNISQGLRTVLETADELILAPDLETIYRRAVELAREKLGVERCGLYLFDAEMEHQIGTFGTDDRGATNDERHIKTDLSPSTAEAFLTKGVRSKIIYDGEQTYWDEAGQKVQVGRGWVASTIVRSTIQPLGIFYNDAALSHSPVNETQQEILTIYCSLLGNMLERKHVEQHLAASEERYRNFIAQSSEGIWRLEHVKPIPVDVPEDEQIQRMYQDAYIAECNVAMARMYGYAQARDLFGKRLGDLLPALDPQSTEYLRNFIRSGYRLEEIESHEIDVSGQDKYFLNTIVGVVENGFLVHSWGLQRDITDQREIETREQHRRTLLEKILKLGITITQETDLQTCLRQIHQSIQKGLGFDRVGLFLYNEHIGEIRGAYGTSRAGDIEDTSWYSQKALDSEVWLNALSQPTKVTLLQNYAGANQPSFGNEMLDVREHVSLAAWAGEKPVALIAADNVISQRPITPEILEALQLFAGYAGLAIENARWNTQLGERVAERTAELQAANQELQAFTYTIAHDLRAPARAMIGFSGLLEESLSEMVELNPISKKYLDRVQTGAKRMGQMIDELLDYTRLGRAPLRKKSVDMSALVNQVLAKLSEETQGKPLELTMTPLPTCEGDTRLLEQVWHQLLINAVKYSQSRPVIKIEIGAGFIEETPYYFIRDNGIGFDMKYLGKLFGVFQRLHIEDEYEGTGMGLALVGRIIERHGGRIWAEAVPEQGATFFFTLTQ